MSGTATVVYNDPNHAPGDVLFLPVLVAIAWLAGFTLRERAAQAEAAEERAIHAEREREAAARIAVAEEPARIARELLAYALPEWRRSRIPVSLQRLAFLARFCSIRAAEGSVAGRRGSSPRSTGAKSWRCSRWPTRKPAACSRPCPRRHARSAGGSSFPTALCFPATAAEALPSWPRSG